MRYTALAISLVMIGPALTGCDALGIETVPQLAAKQDAEAHAIGSACRHAVRSIEDCFKSNPKSVKAAVFNGWKEMDAYMRENEIVGMPSTADSSPEPTKDHSAREPAEDANTAGATERKS